MVWTQVTVIDQLGQAYSTCHTPCHLDLKRNQEYTIRFEKYGYQPVEVRINRKMSDWVGGNLVTGAIAGLIVDYASGSISKLKPDQIQVTMSKTKRRRAAAEAVDGILALDAGELTADQIERCTLRQAADIAGDSHRIPHGAPRKADVLVRGGYCFAMTTTWWCSPGGSVEEVPPLASNIVAAGIGARLSASGQNLVSRLRAGERTCRAAWARTGCDGSPGGSPSRQVRSCALTGVSQHAREGGANNPCDPEWSGQLGDASRSGELRWRLG